MNKEINLKEDLDKILSEIGLSEDQKRKTFKSLEKAIVLNWINSLTSQLSEENTKDFEEKEIETIEEAMKILTEYFPKEKVVEELGNSTEKIIGKFVDKI